MKSKHLLYHARAALYISVTSVSFTFDGRRKPFPCKQERTYQPKNTSEKTAKVIKILKQVYPKWKSKRKFTLEYKSPS